jgi:hypothetical protein
MSLQSRENSTTFCLEIKQKKSKIAKSVFCFFTAELFHIMQLINSLLPHAIVTWLEDGSQS